MTTKAPQQHLTNQMQPKLLKVRSFAAEHLSGIQRSSGDNYCHHGLEMAEALMEVSNDPSLAAVSILHDLPVHPDGKRLLDASPLTKEEKTLVLAMHNLRQLHIHTNVQELDKVIDAFAEDARLLLLRMAHRLNDVRHLDRFPLRRRREIARETLHMYTAISGRLGFHRWRWQMEDICFLVLQPKTAQRMKQRFMEMHDMDQTCLRHAKTFLQEKFLEHGIEADIEERVKGLYSTYRKMILKNRKFEELTDRLALRVLVPNSDDCYRALGIVHQYMHPMRGKLKDYIGSPKENGYRSIHTVVYPLPGVSELPIEIQIRTPQMHQECEFGLASHGDYKNHTYALSTVESRVNLFKNFEHLNMALESRTTFTQALRDSFREDKLLLFDPHNRMYRIPKPATALDFACHMQPEACRLVSAVRINGHERPLDTLLSDGDTVEVTTAKKTLTLKKQLEACRQKTTMDLLKTARKNPM